MSNQENNEYKIFNFTFSPNNKEDTEFEIKNYKYEHKYLISKNNFEDGINYIKNKNKNYNNRNIFYYYNYSTVINSKSNEYVLVDEGFLKKLKCDKNFYKSCFVVYFESGGKHFIYFNDEHILEISETKNENSEENDKNEIKNGENSKINNNKDNNEENNDNNENNILKSLILLYANEKHIQKLLNSSIVDEYEFKDYYLINKDFVDEYKKDKDYKKIFKVLESENYTYSYNGFYFNLDEIIKNNKLDNSKVKQKFYDEKKFYPQTKEIEWPKKNEKINCLDKFILVPENLFSLLYKSVEKANYSKKDYKYKIIIGNKILFIKEKNIKEDFLAYRFENEKFKLFYYFSYEEPLDFFKEVEKYIKGKDFQYYLSEKKLDTEKDKVKPLKDEKGNAIGEYKKIRKISDEEINKQKLDMTIYKFKNITKAYNNFKISLKTSEENNLDTSDINVICSKINNGKLYCLKAGIVLNKDLLNIKKKLFFDEINNLMKYEGKKEYKEKEKNFINKITKVEKEYFINIAKDFNIHNPDSLTKEKNSEYTLINHDIKNIITESDEAEDIQDCYYFKNDNGKEFIIFANRKKIYKIEYNEGCENFKLEEINTDVKNSDDRKSNKDEKKILKKIINNIEKLKENQKDIEKQIDSKFDKFLSAEKYYLVSCKWIKELIKQFKDKKENSNEKIKLSDFLIKNDNLRPDDLQEEIKYDNKEVPINFDIIKKNLFEDILGNINSLKKGDELKSDYLYDISFACNNIMVKELKTNDFFIYSIEEGKYKLEYIIYLEKDRNIKDLLKECKDFDSFLNKYDLNISTKKVQDINISIQKKNRKKNKITYSKEKIGEFIYINPKETENNEEEEDEKEEEEKKNENNNNNKIYKKRRPKNTSPEKIEEKLVHCLGLQNIGATCYMNATIQCLSHVNQFKDYFLNGPLIDSVTSNRNCPLTLEFSSLVNHLWKLPKDNNNQNYYNPTDFKDIISQMNPLFQGIQANDSKDLILFIYETIHKEINNAPYNYNQYTLNNCNNDYELVNFRKSYYPVNSSILVDTFYFEQQSCLKCTRCGFTKISYNIANMLIFPLEKVRQFVYQNTNGQQNSVSLDQCFMQNQIGEVLNGTNQIYCNTCRNMADAVMLNYIYTSPEVLTLILNRGKGLEFNVDFHFDHYINIDNYVIDKSQGKSNLYELICILCHYGPSGMSGHFIAFCKSPIDKVWYCYNDATVTKCEGDPDISKLGNIEGIPYVLYYQRYQNQENNNDNSLKDQFKNVYQSYQENNNINNNENNVQINNFIDNNKCKSQEINNKKSGNKINLNFIYNDNNCQLEVEKTMTIQKLIKKLKKQYKINNDIMVCSEKNNMEPLNYDLKINECDLNDNDTLAIIEI